ncbi:MAG: FAD-binding protein, partial [Chloroflexota bacterium]|nr:FAD-binding protein [Chloroflexota bacterium]
VAYPTLGASLDGMQQAATARMDIEALDLVLDRTEGLRTLPVLWVRLGGLEGVLPQRLAQLRAVLGAGESMAGFVESASWQAVREFGWVPEGWALVKVALTPGRIATLEQFLMTSKALRRYAVGGNLAWIAWPGAIIELNNQLHTLQLSGLVIRGTVEQPRIGLQAGGVFAQRIKQALDPDGRFL